jgi:hypothetical protein
MACRPARCEAKRGYVAALKASRLQDGFNSLASNDIEQHKGRTCRTLFAAFELRNIVRRQIQVVRENGLTNVAFLAEGFDFLACESDHYGWRGTHVPHGNFVMSSFCQKAACMHVTRGFQQLLG